MMTNLARQVSSKWLSKFGDQLRFEAFNMQELKFTYAKVSLSIRGSNTQSLTISLGVYMLYTVGSLGRNEGKTVCYQPGPCDRDRDKIFRHAFTTGSKEPALACITLLTGFAERKAGFGLFHPSKSLITMPMDSLTRYALDVIPNAAPDGVSRKDGDGEHTERLIRCHFDHTTGCGRCTDCLSFLVSFVWAGMMRETMQ